MIQRDGIIVVDKESGPSSFKVVERVKNLLRVKRAGHAGTLDPFASGVLVVLLNQGTKLSPFLMSQDKVYQAALRLGIETDTQDLTGRIIRETPIGRLTGEDIKQNTLQFLGWVKQVPPLYSAVHYRGKRAYELARSGSEANLKARDVRIGYINILSVDLPTVWIEVGCNAGTYIRTLAADMGRSLGTGAHLTFLRRIKSGPFLVDNTSSVAQIAQHLSNDTIDKLIIPLKDALKGMMEVDIPPALARKIRNGYRPGRDELRREDISSLYFGDYLKVVMGNELVAVLKEGSNGYEINRVFA
ncbi:MAG: tRNA pseudouridine(55) synthase TruB [Desulfobacterales bacterium]|nr:tRNA pseudouridine(55) synthase TruB [Desulfobacterales bacterium]